ncbi:MAG: hypothetical protein ACOY0R_12360 [Chloroflexota bacterium]
MNEIVLTQRLKSDYQALPDSVQKKLKKQIRFLAENTNPCKFTAFREQHIGSFISTERIAAFFGKRGQSITCWLPDLIKS